MKDKGLNFNSLLLAVLIGLGTWGLSEIISLGKTTAAFISTQKEINTERGEQMKEVKDRLVAIEGRLASLERRNP